MAPARLLRIGNCWWRAEKPSTSSHVRVMADKGATNQQLPKSLPDFLAVDGVAWLAMGAGGCSGDPERVTVDSRLSFTCWKSGMISNWAHSKIIFSSAVLRLRGFLVLIFCTPISIWKTCDIQRVYTQCPFPEAPRDSLRPSLLLQFIDLYLIQIPLCPFINGVLRAFAKVGP